MSNNQSLEQKIKEVRAAHQKGHATEKYHATFGGTYIRDVVYGANDGIITTFAVVAGVAGANLSSNIVLILGFSNLLADGLAMAIGNYLGTKSEQEYIAKERKMEEWEIKHVPNCEIKEIRDIYKKKGFKGKSLTQMVDLVTSNKKLWVDTMMIDELGILPNDDQSPIKNGLATFLSFGIAGLFPLLPYLFQVPYLEFNLSIVLTGLSLFAVGALRTLITKKHWLIAGLEMLFVGAIAAVVAYTTGHFIDQKLM